MHVSSKVQVILFSPWPDMKSSLTWKCIYNEINMFTKCSETKVKSLKNIHAIVTTTNTLRYGKETLTNLHFYICLRSLTLKHFSVEYSSIRGIFKESCIKYWKSKHMSHVTFLKHKHMDTQNNYQSRGPMYKQYVRTKAMHMPFLTHKLVVIKDECAVRMCQLTQTSDQHAYVFYKYLQVI